MSFILWAAAYDYAVHDCHETAGDGIDQCVEARSNGAHLDDFWGGMGGMGGIGGIC